MKRRLKRCLELLTRIKRLPLLKYANFSTIIKCRLYGLKRLFLRKQHHQTTKPMFLLQKSRFQRYLELLTGILKKPLLKYADFLTIEKCRFYDLISLHLIEQHYRTTKPRYLFQKRCLRSDLELLRQNHGLAPCKICKFFDHSNILFLWFKKAPFEKTTSSNDKPNVSLTEK